MKAPFFPLRSRNKTVTLCRKIHFKALAKTKFLCITRNCFDTKIITTDNPEINIAVDFGTALTLTVTDSAGIIRGLTISPGLGTAVKALATNTAQLPFVPLEAPASSLGSTTKEAIQAGVVLGYKGLVEYLVANIKEDLFKVSGDRPSDVKVVATGGLNSVLKPLTDAFTNVDKNLTIKGLKAVFDIMSGRENK